MNAILTAAGFETGGVDESGAVSFYERVAPDGRVCRAGLDPDGWTAEIYPDAVAANNGSRPDAYVDTGDTRAETLVAYLRADYPGLIPA